MKNKPTGSWLIHSEARAPNIEQLADRECQESWCKDHKLSAWISCGTEQLISHTTETWGWTVSRSELPESLPSAWPPALPPLWLFITFSVHYPSAHNSGKGEQDLGNSRSEVAHAWPFYSLFLTVFSTPFLHQGGAGTWHIYLHGSPKPLLVQRWHRGQELEQATQPDQCRPEASV